MTRRSTVVGALTILLGIAACQSQADDTTEMGSGAAAATKAKCDHFCSSDKQCASQVPDRNDAYCHQTTEEDGSQAHDQDGCPIALCFCKDADGEICPESAPKSTTESDAPDCSWERTCPAGTKYSGKWRYASSGSGVYERQCCKAK